MVSCKQWIKKGLLGSGLLSLGRRLKGPQTIILRYHSVQEYPDDFADSIGRGIIHSLAAFTAQMEWLARSFEPASLEDVAAALQGQRPMPARGVVVTFDDGYADNYEIVAPVLNRLGIPAAFYITVDCIEPPAMPWFCRLRHAFAVAGGDAWVSPVDDRLWRLTDSAERRQAFLDASGACARRSGPAQGELMGAIERGLKVAPLAPKKPLMMSWEQMRELRRQGHIVGSHTLTHPNLAQVERDDAAWELHESKRRLEANLGAEVNHFSYPSPILQPHWSAETTACCEEAGYQTAVTCTPGLIAVGDSPLCLKRISAPETIDDFQWAVRCAFVGRCV